MLLNLGVWVPIRDGDRDAYRLFSRHYSFREYADGRREKKNYANRFLFVGPGFKTVLMTPCGRGLFVWRKFIDDSGQIGVNNAVFINQGVVGCTSSFLILEAEKIAWERWPMERLYTYVDHKKVKSQNPGYCYKMAGWRLCGKTKSGKLVLEKTP